MCFFNPMFGLRTPSRESLQDMEYIMKQGKYQGAKAAVEMLADPHLNLPKLEQQKGGIADGQK